MIDEKYYEGFEGEVEVTIYDDLDKGFKIWEGYFETLLSGCDIVNLQRDGLLYSYVTRDGFYDEQPWKIINLTTVQKELESFQSNRAETESKNMLSEMDLLRNDLVAFVREAQANKLNVYVQYG